MRNPEYSSTDPNSGDVSFRGPLSIEKGDHSNMPSRTQAYAPGFERGHVNASSLGGLNTRDNVVPQHADLNHQAYLSVEKGERSALESGAKINSEKTAVVNSQPGERPSSFMINDSVTYADGHTEAIHHSFTNESYADQSSWNAESASLPTTFEGPNPGDGLRNSMDSESYAELMEQTDASLPNLDAEYAQADFSGMPESTADSSSSVSVDSASDAASGSAGCSADAGSGDGGVSAGCD